MARRERGHPLGRLSGRKRKYHSKFKTPRTRSFPPRKIRLPGISGFHSLLAQAVYQSRTQKLVVTVTARIRESNRGPGIFFKQVYDWSRVKTQDGSLGALMDQTLADTAKKIQEKVLPERGLFIERCAKGKDELVYMTTICSACTCWYCDLSSE